MNNPQRNPSDLSAPDSTQRDPMQPDPPVYESDYEIDIQADDEFSAAVEAANLAASVEAALRRAGVEAASLTVAVVDDATVQQLNRDYRGVDAPTDVLSFANHDEDQDESAASMQLALPAELADEIGVYLGDIVIAYPYAERQAAHYGNSVASELRLLAVHGTLHLLGYDHDTPEAEASMWALQQETLANFGDEALSQRRYEA